MHIVPFLALINLILAFPANVLVVTRVVSVTVIDSPNGLTTLTQTGFDLVTETAGAGATALVLPTLTTEATPTTTEAAPTTEATTEATTAPTTTPATTPTTSTAATSTSSTSTSTGTSSGDGTYYAIGLGACGNTNTDTEYVAAISHELYDESNTSANPNDNPLCGKKINAFYEGKTVQVTVVDRCEGCAKDDLDFSPAAFLQLADQSLGRIKISWEWA